MTLIARISTDDAVHELLRRGNAYVMRTYFANPESEREITLAEAGEWVDIVRRCGGEVFVRFGSSLKTSEPQDAARERTPS